jgi:hypothetical protein
MAKKRGCFIMPTTIGDALGIDYLGAEAIISPSRTAAFATSALAKTSRIPSPIVDVPAMDVGAMLSKQSNGLGDNIDVFG